MQGSFDIVHVKDAVGHTFATRMTNVFVIGKGDKPLVSLPKGKGVRCVQGCNLPRQQGQAPRGHVSCQCHVYMHALGPPLRLFGSSRLGAACGRGGGEDDYWTHLLKPLLRCVLPCRQTILQEQAKLYGKNA